LLLENSRISNFEKDESTIIESYTFLSFSANLKIDLTLSSNRARVSKKSLVLTFYMVLIILAGVNPIITGAYLPPITNLSAKLNNKSESD
jgi:hypothetical protein